MKPYLHATLLLACLSPTLHALDLGELAKQVLSTQTQETGQAQPKSVLGAGLAESDIAAGLKQALRQGTRFAVESLGQEGGFLNNAAVKIPVPESLGLVEAGLRKMGQGKYADDFIAALNQAAEQAVPAAAEVFGKSIESLSIEDARKILNGGDNAATRYFQDSGTAELTQRILPIVRQATEKAGVTHAYKALQAQTKGMDFSALNSLLGGKSPTEVDLDAYITDKSLAGLFTLIAEQEQKIRGDAAARGTDLLKKVFGGAN